MYYDDSQSPFSRTHTYTIPPASSTRPTTRRFTNPNPVTSDLSLVRCRPNDGANKGESQRFEQALGSRIPTRDSTSADRDWRREPTDPYSDPTILKNAEESLRDVEWAAAANERLGLKPPDASQSPLSDRMEIVNSDESGESRRIAVHWETDTTMTLFLAGKTVNLPNGELTKVRPTTLIYDMNHEGISSLDLDTWSAHLNIFQAIHAIHPHIPDKYKQSMASSLLDSAKGWYHQEVSESTGYSADPNFSIRRFHTAPRGGYRVAYSKPAPFPESGCYCQSICCFCGQSFH